MFVFRIREDFVIEFGLAKERAGTPMTRKNRIGAWLRIGDFAMTMAEAQLNGVPLGVLKKTKKQNRSEEDLYQFHRDKYDKGTRMVEQATVALDNLGRSVPKAPLDPRELTDAQYETVEAAVCAKEVLHRKLFAARFENRLLKGVLRGELDYAADIVKDVEKRARFYTQSNILHPYDHGAASDEEVVRSEPDPVPQLACEADFPQAESFAHKHRAGRARRGDDSPDNDRPKAKAAAKAAPAKPRDDRDDDAFEEPTRHHHKRPRD